MIPASYMFKQVYRDTWEAAGATVQPRHSVMRGLLTPLAAAIEAFHLRRSTLPDRRFGQPVCH